MFGIKNNSKIIRLKKIKNETTIGRHSTNDVIMITKSLKVSRFHAVIKFFDDIPFIKDVSDEKISEWGVFINGTSLVKRRWVEMQIGDKLSFGALTVEESGYVMEIVEMESEEDEPRAPPSVMKRESVNIISDEIIDLEDDDNQIQNEERSPQLSSSTTAAETTTTNDRPSSPCFVLSDDDDEIVFSEVSSVNNIDEVTAQTTKPMIVSNKTECKPLDVTSTMNGLLKPAPIKPSLPSPPLIPPTPPSHDDIENQLAVVLGQDPSVNSVDVKPSMPPNVKQEYINDTQELHNVLQNVFNNYSNTDEIISLDSDDEDFPSSQLNTTCVTDIPDYSSSFNMMYELKSEVPSDDEDVEFISSDPWFEPLSQTTVDVKSEMSKSWRKTEAVSKDADSSSMDIEEPSAEVEELYDFVDNASSNDSPIVPATESISSASPSSTFTEPCSSSCLNESPEFVSPNPLLKKSEKQVAVIKPLPLPNRRHKRRSVDDDEVTQKRRKERHGSPDSTNHRSHTSEQRYSEKKKKSSHRSSSSTFQKETREKVKALYPEPPPETEKKPKENRTQPKVKVTTKNRGDFLTKAEPAPNADKSKTNGECSSNKTSSKSESDELIGRIHRPKIRVAHDKKVPAITDIDIFKSPSASPSENDEIPVNSRTVFPKLPITSSSKTRAKSILKKSVGSKLTYENNLLSGQSKKVKFPVAVVSDFKEVDAYIDATELAMWRKNELTIRECTIEFNRALSVILKWNVNWFQEQQKNTQPPPLYLTIYQDGTAIVDKVEKYIEELKYSIFHMVWKQMFAFWNQPNNDNFPLTQDPNCRDYYTIEIGKVEGSSRDPTNTVFTIHAESYALELATCVGRMSMLNFQITQHRTGIPSKSRAFAYISGCTKSIRAGRSCCSMTLKIYAKAFSIIQGEAKMKVLNYAKTQLKFFHAFGMTKTCPLIDAICDVNFQDSLNSTAAKLTTKFKTVLNSMQRKAVLTSKNCFDKERSINFIDGLQGTGKTQAIVGLMHELANSNFNDKVLIITVNDKLADDLVYRICKDGYVKNVLRFGNCAGINSNVRHCAFDYKVDEFMKSQGKNLVVVEDEVKLARARLHCNKLLSDKNQDMSGRIRQSEKEIEDLGKENSSNITKIQFQLAQQEVVKSANIVVTTFPTCWSSNFETFFVPSSVNKGDISSFKVCIFDDANCHDETAMLIPQMLQVPHLVLVGDRKNRWWPNSPYHKILYHFDKNNKDFVTYLDENIRIHQDVSCWVREYYQLNTDLKIPLMKRKSKLKPYIIIDHISDILIDNYQAILCEKLANCIIDIEPERSQALVSVLVARESEKEKIRGLFSSNLQRKVIVDHFDRYSTRENDIIILCLPSLRISEQWLYIAMTRAKTTLIVCGDFNEIEPPPVIKSLIEYGKKHDVFHSLRSPDLISSENLKNVLMVPQS